MLTTNKSKSLLKLLNNTYSKCFKHKKAKKVLAKEKSYTSTVNLPKTDFQLWVNKFNITERDENIIKSEEFASLYNWQREKVDGPEFVLHDGPPYANGIPHMGHAINKVLKDIITRHKLLLGHRVHYRPGWDCHGLPIELKATTSHEPNATLSPLDIRRTARRFAKEAIEDQKVVFRSWGVMADWDSDCYHTYDKSYVKNQLQQFYKLFERGLVYRDVKPVYWSPSSRTALAESELEYRDDHKSTSTYVRLRLANAPQQWGTDVFVLVWTTTPWTLPANQAVAYSPSLSYCLVSLGGRPPSERYLVAKPTVDQLAGVLKRELKVIKDVDVNELSSLRYDHPLEPSEPLPMMAASHVTSAKGTGLVHTAPAHGPDDYKLALAHNMSVRCLVDEDGYYSEEAGPALAGLSVLTQGTERVLELCHTAGALIHCETFSHSYPYDWRTNLPVIQRASQQWFFDTTAVKQAAIDAMSRVSVVPERGMAGFMSQVKNRPFWCISRQRVWGVPIPMLYTPTGEHIISKELVDHYCGLLDSVGDDFWWSVPLSELAPDNLLASWNIKPQDLTKGQDILDIWMDSGLSWSSVLDCPTADLYLEGVDQFNGWFQSSLLMSIALQGVSPYKTVFVHGFAVDGAGLKMCKSLGNVVNPQDIVYGSTDQTIPTMGVDVLRWWVAAHGSHQTNVPVSDATLDESRSEVQRLRAVLRFLLGAVNGMPPPPGHYQRTGLTHLDRFMMHSLHAFLEQIVEHYENYQFNRVCSTLTHFVANQVSGIYCSLIKDRLYCMAEDSPGRRAAQLTLYHTLTSVTRALAPILPVLAEEVYKHQPHADGGSVFHRVGHEVWNDPAWRDDAAAAIVKQALDIKQQVVRLSPLNSNSLDVSVMISAPKPLWSILQALHPEAESSDSELVEILQVSRVRLSPHDSELQLKVELSGAHSCERCRRYTAPAPDTLCSRCEQLLAAQS